MGVGLDLAGRSVRCPHCQEVVLAPVLAPAPVDAPAMPPASDEPMRELFSNIVPRESAESIFADPEDSEDSVFSAFEMKRPMLPPMGPQEPSPMGNAAPMPMPSYQPPLPPPPTPNTASLDPFEDTEESEELPRRSKKSAKATPSIDLKTLALIVLTGYALLMTILAVWGWSRSPVAHEATPPKKTK